MLLVFSCIDQEVVPQLEQESTSEIKNIKQWFDSNKESLNREATDSRARVMDKDLILPFFEKEPDWSKFSEYHFQDGRKVYEIHLRNLSGIMPKDFFDQYGDVGDDLIEESLLFVEQPGSEEGYAVLVARYFSYGQKSKGMTYHRIPKEWSGRMDIFTYSERHLRTFEVEEGRLTSYHIYQIEDPSKRIQTHNALMICSSFTLEFPYIYGINMGIGSNTAIISITSCHNPNPGGGAGSGSWPSAPGVSPTYTGSGGGIGSPSGGGSTGTTPCNNTNHFGSDCIPFPEEDDEIIKDPSFINTTADCIYEKLKSIDGFKHLASGFEGLGTEFDIKLKIGPTQDPKANAQAWWRGPNKPIEITLNEANIDRSALEVARTIVHEMIHAELYRAINTTNPSEKELDFRETFNTYVMMYRGPGDQQHNLMADEWVTEMGKILKDVHQMLDPDGYNKFKDVYYPTGIPKRFYESVAWDGLQGTIAWNLMKNITTTPPIKSPLEIITQDIDNVKRGRKNCL